MTARRVIPLNPCDCCIHAQELAGYANQGLVNLLCMVIDLDGRPRPEIVRSRVIRALAETPETLAELGHSPLRLRPFWRLPDDPLRAAEKTADAVFSFEDLSDRQEQDALDGFDARSSEGNFANWDLVRGPQVRFRLIALPGRRARLVIRWPHHFMDAEGGHMLAARLDDQWTDAPAQLAAKRCRTTPRPLHGISILRRLSLAVRGARSPTLSGIESPAWPPNVTPLVAGAAPGQRDQRFISRHWKGADADRIVAGSRETTPAGFAGFSRFLAAGTIRAQHRLYREEGAHTEGYAITFPISIHASPEEMRLIDERPIAGNYLISPTLQCTTGDAEDRGRVAETLLRQVEAFLRADGIRAQWAALETAALVHHWFYGRLFRMSAMSGSYSSGFSYFGGFPNPPRRIDGARVTNIWGAAPTTTPPGLNPVFGRFDDYLNLSVTYNRPEVPARLARRYMELIVEELESPT